MSKKLILLVEDNLDILQNLTDFIEMDNTYKVIGLTNAYEAFQWLANNPHPDIVLTDFNMPGRGELLAQAVHRLGIPCIILTAAPEEAAMEVYKLKVRIPVVSKVICAFEIMKMIDTMTATVVEA
jgi:CheY-like chemotaxis protein